MTIHFSLKSLDSVFLHVTVEGFNIHSYKGS